MLFGSQGSQVSRIDTYRGIELEYEGFKRRYIIAIGRLTLSLYVDVEVIIEDKRISMIKGRRSTKSWKESRRGRRRVGGLMRPIYRLFRYPSRPASCFCYEFY